MAIEDEYLDVLQNIEFAVVSVYHHTPALLDYDVLEAIEALTRHYVLEERHQTPPARRLPERAQQVFEAVQEMCEWRLGRQPLGIQGDPSSEVAPTPLTVGEIIGCLKRIRISIRLWNKQGGRQGYLTFVSQFLS